MKSSWRYGRPRRRLAVGISAATGSYPDQTGDMVRAASWAEGTFARRSAPGKVQLEAIGEELRMSNYGARPTDGATGDSSRARSAP